MTKKQSKIKKVIKAIKPTKVKLDFKKEEPNKVSKNIKNKVVKPPLEKASKASSNVVKKKLIAKKIAKPVKSVKKIAVSLKQKSGSAKGGKISIAPILVKKSLTKKPSGKLSQITEDKDKSKKNIKSEKEIAIKKKQPKEIKKNSIGKPTKIVKVEKAVKKEKTVKAEKFEFEEKLIKPVKKSKGGRKPKNKTDDVDEPIVENDILIEQLINSTKRLKKPSKVPKQLRTFTNPMASLTVAKLIETNKKGSAHPKKEPKGKFELEYVMHTSAGILYEFLTSPSGLAEWFADDVNIHDGIFTFFWEGSEQKAKLIGFKEEKFVRLQWLDKPDGTYFEFRIEKDDLTSDISLIITDFADEAADLKTSTLLWDSQVNQLLHVIGSY